MINIIYYESSSGFGGSSSNLYHILRQLDKTKFNPIVVVHKDGDQFERIKSLGVEVIKLPYPQIEEVNRAGGFKLLWLMLTIVQPLSMTLLKLIKQRDIDVVHINTNILLGIPMILAAKRAKKKIFCYIRESRSLIKRERHFVKDINQFFILNHQALEMYKKDIPENKLNVVYDGVDLDDFTDLSPKMFLEEFKLAGCKVVGLVGRIIRGKGQLEFAQTSKLVCEKYPNVKFVIVGDAKGENTQYLNEVKRYVTKEHLADKVIFTGWRTDVKQIMAGLDVLVLASTTFPEGLPNAIIEAMALNKPAVATDIPGPPEIIADGETGFIVPPGDVDVMAEKITYLLENEDRAVEMGRAGRQRAENLFDVRKVVRRAQELYEAELKNT